MKSAWLDQLEKSKTLKIKFKGKMYPVPPPIFRQAKKFALQSVGIDYDIFKNNPTTEKSKEKAVKKAFEQFLESYLESIVPDTKSNPSAKKISAAFKIMDQLTDADKEGGLMKTWFKDKSALEQKQMGTALKGAIMIITHIFTEGNAKIAKEKFGFKEDQSPEGQKEVQYNRLMRATVGLMTMNLIAKLYSLDAKKLEQKLKTVVPSSQLAEFWRDPKKSEAFFSKMKAQSINVLSPVDLLETIKESL